MTKWIITLYLTACSFIAVCQDSYPESVKQIIKHDSEIEEYWFINSFQQNTLNDSILVVTLELDDSLVCSSKRIYTVKNGIPYENLVISISCDHPQDEEIMEYSEGQLIGDDQIEIVRVEENIFTDEVKRTREQYSIHSDGRIIKNAP